MENSRVRAAGAVTFLLLAVVSCASEHPQPNPATPAPEAKVAGQGENASFIVQIKFSPHSAGLTTLAKDILDQSMSKARRSGTIDEVKVLAWADAEYPSKENKHLSKNEQNLAAKRNQAINNYLHQQTNASVKTYNMAERPNAMETLLSTSDARIKHTLEEAGMATTAYNLRSPENASKAVVMVILK